MSSRTIAIVVQNDTDLLLNLTKKDLTHGKWINEPDKSIISSSADSWEAGNKDGALIGTAGTVVYTNGAYEFKIEFDHPLGPSATVVSHSANGQYSSKLENDNLQHHHCSCTICFYKK